MKHREFEVLVTKLKLETRNTGDRHAFFVYKGKVITKTKRSHGHGEMPDYWVRQQLKVNESQLAGLLDCTVQLEDYIKILRQRGLIDA